MQLNLTTNFLVDKRCGSFTEISQDSSNSTSLSGSSCRSRCLLAREGISQSELYLLKINLLPGLLKSLHWGYSTLDPRKSISVTETTNLQVHRTYVNWHRGYFADHCILHIGVKLSNLCIQNWGHISQFLLCTLINEIYSHISVCLHVLSKHPKCKYTQIICDSALCPEGSTTSVNPTVLLKH